MTMDNRRRRRMISSLVVVALATSACAGSDPDGQAGGAVVAQAELALPVETLEDWRTYGMRLATVTVVAEQRGNATPIVDELGEGPIGRTVTLDIDDPLWTDTTSWGRDLPTPSTLTIETEGWVVGESGERPMSTAGFARLEVGHEYLVMLSQAPENQATGSDAHTWALMAQLGIVDGRVVSPGHSRLADTLEGKTPNEVADLLDAETVERRDGNAYEELPPYERAIAIATGHVPSGIEE